LSLAPDTDYAARSISANRPGPFWVFGYGSIRESDIIEGLSRSRRLLPN
jgi:hypothetical protein